MCLLLAYGMAAFSANRYPLLWPLRALRVMGSLSGGILYIPLLQVRSRLDERLSVRLLCSLLLAAATACGHATS